MLQLIIRRLMAYMLDIALLYALLAGGLQMLTRQLFGVPDWARLAHSPYRLEGWVLLTISLPTWLYFIWSDRSGGTTLGKRLFNLRATDLSGGNIRFGQALLRTALKLLPWELTHISVLIPNPLWNPAAVPAVSQSIGLVVANLLMVVYLGALVIRRGERSIHDLAASTKVTRRGD